MQVKIGDFGMAKLEGTDPSLKADISTFHHYLSPEMGIPLKGDLSESRFAVDLWAFGCITHELLTQATPFATCKEMISYLNGQEFARRNLFHRGISDKGIEFIERTITRKAENRITAKQALESEWLQEPL